MSSRTGVLLCAISSVGMVSAAQAGEYQDWSGLYVGVQGGYALLGGTLSESGNHNASEAIDDASGLIGGLIGIQTQQQDFLFGAEADFSALNLSDRADFSFGRASRLTEDADWFSSIRGRAGVIQGSMLFYATGGVAFLGQTFSYMPFFGGGDESSVLVGWTVGAGIEMAFGEGWSARAEYLRADFNSRSLTYPGIIYPTTTGTVDSALDLIRFAVVKKF